MTGAMGLWFIRARTAGWIGGEPYFDVRLEHGETEVTVPVDRATFDAAIPGSYASLSVHLVTIEEPS